jgi:hypothetical protein
VEKSPTHFEPGPWRDVSTETGIRTLEVTNFEAFFHFVCRFGANGTDDRYLWRGQRCASWKINSTLARDSKSHFKEIHLNRFLRAAARHSEIPNNVSTDEEALKFWSLGQHWGLKTPLIDFTVYPYFALFFAFAEDDKRNKGSRAVFALDANQISSVNFEIIETLGIQPFKQKLDNPPYEKDFADELINEYGGLHKDVSTMVAAGAVPDVVKNRICELQFLKEKRKELKFCGPGLSENKRIHAQGGCHVYTMEDVSIQTWVRRHRKMGAKLGGRPILTKITIPNSERASILSNLNKMNVNYLTVFPDLEGAAKHCNLALGQRHLGRNKDY